MPASFSLSNQLRLRTKVYFNSWLNLDYERQKAESESWSLTAADQLFADSKVDIDDVTALISRVLKGQ